MGGGGDGSKNPGGSARETAAPKFRQRPQVFRFPGTGIPLARASQQRDKRRPKSSDPGGIAMRGPRGPAPTPNVVKLLRGNPGKRAIRPEPQPEIPPEVPEPPPILTGAAKAEWVRVAGQLHRIG